MSLDFRSIYIWIMIISGDFESDSPISLWYSAKYFSSNFSCFFIGSFMLISIFSYNLIRAFYTFTNNYVTILFFYLFSDSYAAFSMLKFDYVGFYPRMALVSAVLFSVECVCRLVKNPETVLDSLWYILLFWFSLSSVFNIFSHFFNVTLLFSYLWSEKKSSPSSNRILAIYNWW